MFRTVYNRALLEFRLEATSPLLIKSGGRSADPSRPDMEFVRTRNVDGASTVFIPGSSAKGVTRSYAERLLRSAFSEADLAACDPTDRSDNCGRRVGQEVRDARRREKREPSLGERYRRSCPACRLFGSTEIASRVQFTDLMPLATARVVTETRTGIGVDRLLGSAARGALFEFEVATVGSRFHGEILIENYELWQLSLLTSSLADLNAGFVRIGFGSSRGLGRVAVHYEKLQIEQARHSQASTRMVGIGELATEPERQEFGLQSSDHVTSPAGPPSVNWLFDRWMFDQEAEIGTVLDAARSVEIPRNMVPRRSAGGGRQ